MTHGCMLQIMLVTYMAGTSLIYIRGSICCHMLDILSQMLLCSTLRGTCGLALRLSPASPHTATSMAWQQEVCCMEAAHLLLFVAAV